MEIRITKISKLLTFMDTYNLHNIIMNHTSLLIIYPLFNMAIQKKKDYYTIFILIIK